MILEKAWSKLHGSYARADNGSPDDAMVHLFGMPASDVHLKSTYKDVDSFWNEICDFDRRDFMMFNHGLPRDPSTGEELDINGIVGGHVYTMLGTIEFFKDGQKIRLVKMRNPWGQGGEWAGSWGD